MSWRGCNARWAALGSHLYRKLFAFSFALSILAAACGVPIAAYELTPTPEGQTIDAVPVSRSLAVAATTPLSTSVLSLGAVTAVTALTPAATRSTATATGTATAAVPPASATPATTQGPSATAAVTITPGPNTTVSPSVPPASGNLPADALTYLNSYRTSHGLAALRQNASLTAAAGAYAKLMAEKSWFTCGCDPHRGPDGSSPESRIRAAGYQYSAFGEALAAGQVTGAAAVNAWLASPAHAAIALNATATDVGIGYAYNAADPYRHYWVLETAAP